MKNQSKQLVLLTQTNPCAGPACLLQRDVGMDLTGDLGVPQGWRCSQGAGETCMGNAGKCMKTWLL